MDYQTLELPYHRCIDQDARSPTRHPAAIVGAGPVGLTLAIDLAQRGVSVIVLDDDCRLSTGSRAICFSKRTLEIWDRLGVGQRMVDQGVSWKVGKVFFRDELVYTFDLLPESGHCRPAFINLQQYYCEGFLYEHAAAQERIDLRWTNRVTGIESGGDSVALTVETPEGRYALLADYVVACDGSRSAVRSLLGLEARGQVFRDRFLIADVRMTSDFPTERWFWFDPPFHPDQSVLLHRQSGDVWRIDFQLGWDADPNEARKPENVIPRIRAMLGPHAAFELVWVSVYTFACQRMERFCHGRVLFAGDAAHLVSPFGARGANSGVQDADNLAWKLALVLAGKAPARLLDSYGTEREPAADENLLNSTRSTDFITPKSEVSRTFRDAVLMLAKDHPFARRLVNSGRLSTPATLRDSSLNTADSEPFAGMLVPGAPMCDAPIRVEERDGWLLRALDVGFNGLLFSDGGRPASTAVRAIEALEKDRVPVRTRVVTATGSAGTDDRCLEDAGGLLAKRCDARDGTYYLLRPDQHVCARWRTFDIDRVRAAVARATCNG